MPVYKDEKTGTWFYSYKRRDPVSGAWKHIKKRGFPTRREAVAAERETLAEKSPKSSATFREMVDLWEQYSATSAEANRKHHEHFDIRFSKYQDLPMDALTKPVLSRFRAELSQDDRFSTTTKNRTISYVRSVLRFAHNVYDLPDHSAVLTRLKETDQEALQEFSVWSPEEFDTFIEYVENPLYTLFYRFLFWTGCRRGEAIALQKTEVGDHAVTFKYSQRTQKEGLKPTKTRAKRTIRIDDQLYDQLQPLMDEPGTYVFGGETGLSPNMIDHYFSKAVKASGVKRIRIHDLRHSHASWLINSGVNIVAVSKRLGHKDITTTLNQYTHLLEATDNNMMEKINAYKSK